MPEAPLELVVLTPICADRREQGARLPISALIFTLHIEFRFAVCVSGVMLDRGIDGVVVVLSHSEIQSKTMRPRVVYAIPTGLAWAISSLAMGRT